jgi:hypothetical protein
MSLSILALELRLMIWDLVLEEPRNFELRVAHPERIVYFGRQTQIRIQTKFSRTDLYPPELPIIELHRTQIPLLLKICAESRRYGLNIYHPLNFGGHFGGYINFQFDMLVVSPDLFPCLGYFHQRSLFPFSTFSRLQHIAFYIPGKRAIEPVYKLLRMASTLQEVRTITILADRVPCQRYQEKVLKWYDDLRQESGSLGEPQPLVNWGFGAVSQARDWNLENTFCRHNRVVYICSSCAKDLQGLDPMPFYTLGIHHSRVGSELIVVLKEVGGWMTG